MSKSTKELIPYILMNFGVVYQLALLDTIYANIIIAVVVLQLFSIWRLISAKLAAQEKLDAVANLLFSIQEKSKK